MDIIGMLYADELIYIFEGPKPKLITVPKIPLQIDTSVIQPVQFALMDAGASIPLSELQGIPEIFIFVVDDEATLSTWGRLIWNKGKKDFLSRELLPFPHLSYKPSFLEDYERIKNVKERVKLQETLAKVACLLIKSDGDTNILRRDSSLLYSKFENMDINYFRVTQQHRVTCVFSERVLHLRRYGIHPFIENNQ